MFEREHHRRIATVLASLEAGVLAANACLFGGGTAMALRYGEYRESVDIDFLVSEPSGYRELRQRLTGADGLYAIAAPDPPWKQARDLRADQYGIRTMIRLDEIEIKFEIVLEARMHLQPPGPDDQLCGVATLTPLDMATSKLLANSDRWADDSVFSRDLIDLAMMAPPEALLRDAIAKAQAAYGTSVTADLKRAIDALRQRPHRLERCMLALQMDTTPKALLWDRIRALDVLL